MDRDNVNQFKQIDTFNSFSQERVVQKWCLPIHEAMTQASLHTRAV